MTLRQKQSKFTYMTALLVLHAYHLGYELTEGDSYRDPRVGYGHKDSLHRKRLAKDYNLFRDGRYLKSTKAWLPIGEYWESIGGTWGGRFDDGNHFSLAHGGMK
ncbi:MAG: M15 family metallopeptidase [Nitrospira sp.]